MTVPAQDDKVRQLIAEQAADWFVAQQSGPLPPERAQAFMTWLRTSPLHVAEYLAVAGIAKDARDAAIDCTVSVDDLLGQSDASASVTRLGSPRQDRPSARVDETMSENLPCVRSRRLCGACRRPRVRRAIAIVAASVVLAIALGGVAWFAQRPTGHTYVTRHGQMRTLLLADGSLVKLDSDSVLAVQIDARHRRITLRRGQAYFEVAKFPNAPFTVHVGQTMIRDIGTVFDVARHKSSTTVTVVEGSVRVWHMPSGDKPSVLGLLPWTKNAATPPGQPIATLGAGQKLRVDAAGRAYSRKDVDMHQILAWTHGKIAFDNQPIAVVAAQFNRYNVLRLTIKGARVRALRISGTFNEHDVAAFVAFLDSMPSVSVKRRGSQIVVYRESVPSERK